jgi:hypothetical protein
MLTEYDMLRRMVYGGKEASEPMALLCTTITLKFVTLGY